MEGVRTGIPRPAVKIEADARGIELSEHRMDKFLACEALIRRQDATIAEAKRKAEEAKRT